MQVLKMTVLVAVLTVLISSGTTVRMVEVLQIRTGAEDEGASDDEETGHSFVWDERWQKLVAYEEEFGWWWQ
jgi:hypothetical protein